MTIHMTQLGHSWLRVALSGENITDSFGSPTATAGVRINTDGTVDKNETGVYSQIDSSTDWIIPNAAASSAYYVKAEQVSSSGPGTRTGTLSTWLQLTSNREWKISATAIASWTLDISISKDGGTTTIDTGRYVLATDPL